jgi:transposase-like protein
MILADIYAKFPTRESCMAYLEQVRWAGKVACPYCRSRRVSELPKERRWHCNKCKSSFSVMTNTIFHGTRVDLQKWFFTISLFRDSGEIDVTGRPLARLIGVNRNTACYMVERIERQRMEQRRLIEGILTALPLE